MFHLLCTIQSGLLSLRQLAEGDTGRLHGVLRRLCNVGAVAQTSTDIPQKGEKFLARPAIKVRRKSDRLARNST